MNDLDDTYESDEMPWTRADEEQMWAIADYYDDEKGELNHDDN
jgi:hypothetical protein